MIKFSCNHYYISNFFKRYESWVALQNMTAPHKSQAMVVDDTSDSIRIYSRREVEEIKQDPRRVVGIELKEGIKEFSALEATMPRDKHYIIFSGSYPSEPPKLDLDYTLVCHEGILCQIYDLHLHSYGPFFCANRNYNFNDPKPYQFVAFNATTRPHRTKFAEWLKELPYSNFVFRLNKQDLGQPADHIDFVDFSKVDVELSEWFEHTARHTSDPHLHLMGRIPTEMLNQARFNLVLETAHDFHTFDTTEKTIRPLILGMPFVTASAQGHLKRLHSLGFQTYNQLWDESYDDEPNNQLRLRKVFELVKELGSFDWEGNRTLLEQIGLHNRANFTNLGWYFDQEFRQFEQIMQEFQKLNLIDVQE